MISLQGHYIHSLQPL